MKKSKMKRYIIIFFIFLVIFLGGRFILKDYFNMFLELIYLRKNEKLVINNKLLDNYIFSLEEDIKKYKEISNLKDCITGTVIYRNPSNWYDELIINKGKKDNIKKGNIIINDEGLVGVVSNVLNNSSVVSLITNVNEKSKITVGIKNDDYVVYGIISGYDKLKNEIVVSELSKDIVYNDGLDVITTGFTNTFKEGIVIAYVKRIEEDSNGLSKNAIVEPVVNYNDIRYVCVIKDN